MQVSRATAQLNDVLQEWRERHMGEITYLYVVPVTRRFVRMDK